MRRHTPSRICAWILIALVACSVLPLTALADNVTFNAQVSGTGLPLPVPTMNSEPAVSCTTVNTVSWTVTVGPGELQVPREYSVERSTSASFPIASTEVSPWITIQQYTFTNLVEATHYYRVRDRELDLPANVSGYSSTTSSRQVQSTVAIPTINNLPISGYTNQAASYLFGFKDPYTSVHINSIEVVGDTAVGTWSSIQALTEGTNTLTVSGASDECGVSSSSTAYAVILDTVVPVVTADADNDTTTQSTVRITGTKSPDANLFENGVEVKPITTASTWVRTVPLSMGNNVFNYSSEDIAGNTSTTVRVVVRRESPANNDDDDEDEPAPTDPDTDDPDPTPDPDVPDDTGGPDDTGDPDAPTDPEPDTGDPDITPDPIDNTGDPDDQDPITPVDPDTDEPDTDPVDDPVPDPDDADPDEPDDADPVIDKPIPDEEPIVDDDDDGIDDEFENDHFGNIDVIGDRDGDFDGDGLTDDEEAAHGTDPTDFDTDGDGLSDGDEVDRHNTDPTLYDTDTDLFDDGIEIIVNTDPNDPNSVPTDENNDGIADRWLELFYGILTPTPDLMAADDDNDGIPNLQEYFAHTDPTNPDSDGDGFLDGEELNEFGTDPRSEKSTPESIGVMFLNLDNVDLIGDTSPVAFGRAPKHARIEVRAFRDNDDPILLGEVVANEDGYFIINIDQTLADGEYEFRAFLLGKDNAILRKSPPANIEITASFTITAPAVISLGGRDLAALPPGAELLIRDTQPLLVGNGPTETIITILWLSDAGWSVSYEQTDAQGAFEARSRYPLAAGTHTAILYSTDRDGLRSKATKIPFEIITEGSLHALLNPLQYADSNAPRDMEMPIIGLLVAGLLVAGGAVHDYLKYGRQAWFFFWARKRRQKSDTTS